MSSWLAERPVPRAVGALLALAVAGYTLVLTIAGGIVDSSRPTTERAVHEGIETYLAGRQNSARLFAAFKGRATGRSESAIVAFEFSNAVFSEISGHVAEHKAIAFKRASAQEPQVFDLARFEAEERPALGAVADVTAESVERKTALYEPGRDYEIIGASAGDAESVFREYVEAAVRANWLVHAGSYDPKMRRGWLSGRRKGGELMIGVWNEGVFPGPDGKKYPTTTYVHITGEDLKW